MRSNRDLQSCAPPSCSVATICIFAMIALAAAMGVGRFAFTPLLPLMVRDGLLPQNAGAWLAASNYLGYMLGALTASRIGASPQSLLRASLVGIAVMTAAIGTSHELPVWVALRFAAGVLSAWALLSTSAWALSRLAFAQRSDLAGIVYAGVGLGIALVGAYCLAAAHRGVLSETLWLQLGALTAVAVATPALLVDRSADVSTVTVR